MITRKELIMTTTPIAEFSPPDPVARPISLDPGPVAEGKDGQLARVKAEVNAPGRTVTGKAVGRLPEQQKQFPTDNLDDTIVARWRERGRRDCWRDLVGRLFVPAREDRGLLDDSSADHEWFRLPSYGGYLVACSCGWYSIDTQHLGRMLCQVKDHLHAARQAQEALR
jgi:hypothetical protein